MADQDSTQSNSGQERTQKKDPKFSFFSIPRYTMDYVKHAQKKGLYPDWRKKTLYTGYKERSKNDSNIGAIDTLLKAYDNERNSFQKLQKLDHLDSFLSYHQNGYGKNRAVIIQELQNKVKNSLKELLLDTNTLKNSYEHIENDFEKYAIQNKIDFFYQKWSNDFNNNELQNVQEYRREIQQNLQLEGIKDSLDTYLHNKPNENQYQKDPTGAVERKVAQTREKIAQIKDSTELSEEDKLNLESKEVFNLVSQMLYDNTIHLVEDSEALAKVYLQKYEDHPSQGDINSQKDVIEGNRTRGFTDEKTGHIYMIAPGNNDLAHDLLHEAVHLLSAKNGHSKIHDEINIFNEGITEYFTKKYIPNVPIDDAEAYLIPTRLIEKLVDAVGEDTIQKAYFENEGLETIKEELVEWYMKTNDSSEIERATIKKDVDNLFNNFSTDESKKIETNDFIAKVFGEDIANEVIHVSQEERRDLMSKAEKTEKEAKKIHAKVQTPKSGEEAIKLKNNGILGFFNRKNDQKNLGQQEEKVETKQKNAKKDSKLKAFTKVQPVSERRKSSEKVRKQSRNSNSRRNSKTPGVG